MLKALVHNSFMAALQSMLLLSKSSGAYYLLLLLFFCMRNVHAKMGITAHRRTCFPPILARVRCSCVAHFSPLHPLSRDRSPVLGCHFISPPILARHFIITHRMMTTPSTRRLPSNVRFRYSCLHAVDDGNQILCDVK